MTKESLMLFAELLGKITVNPMASDAEQAWKRIMDAKREIENDLKNE